MVRDRQPEPVIVEQMHLEPDEWGHGEVPLHAESQVGPLPEGPLLGTRVEPTQIGHLDVRNHMRVDDLQRSAVPVLEQEGGPQHCVPIDELLHSGVELPAVQQCSQLNGVQVFVEGGARCVEGMEHHPLLQGCHGIGVHGALREAGPVLLVEQ